MPCKVDIFHLIFVVLETDKKRACSSGARARGYELRCRGFKSFLARTLNFLFFICSLSNFNKIKRSSKVFFGVSPSQVRQWTLTPSFVGSNPPTPDSIKRKNNENIYTVLR